MTKLAAVKLDQDQLIKAVSMYVTIRHPEWEGREVFIHFALMETPTSTTLEATVSDGGWHD
jgi:hypothetical protein